MDSTLTVEQANRTKKRLPTSLKFILHNKFRGVISNQYMDESDLSYMRALIDADIEGAQELYDYIEKYNEVILNEEF